MVQGISQEKMFAKKLKAVRPISCRESEKEKESDCKVLCADAQTQ